MTSVVIAVDIGSSGVRAHAFDPDLGVVATTDRPLATQGGQDGRSSQSWTEISEATLDCIRRLVPLAGLPVQAIVLSGTASCLATSVRTSTGRHEVIDDVVLWSDTRAKAFAASVGAAQATGYGRTLCPPNVSYWPAKVLWLSENRDVALSELSFAGAKDYLFEALTGQWWTDPMSAAATGMFDSLAWQWDTELLELTAVGIDRLPEVRAATDSAPLLPELAAELGLAASVPVVVGGMDGPLAQFGAAGYDGRFATCTVGTSIAVRASSAVRIVDPEQRLWCYPIAPDLWVLGGAGSNGGNVVGWLADILGPATDVGTLVSAALSIESDENLTFLPYLWGERAPLWRDDLTASLIGLRSHHGSVDIARAAIDGVAAAVIELAAAVTNGVAAAGAQSIERFYLTGGFLHSAAWSQLITDALGTVTCVGVPEQATAAGAGLLAWMSLGLAPHDVTPRPQIDERHPNPSAHAHLARKSGTARRLRAALHPVAAEGRPAQ